VYFIGWSLGYTVLTPSDFYPGPQPFPNLKPTLSLVFIIFNPDQLSRHGLALCGFHDICSTKRLCSLTGNAQILVFINLKIVYTKVFPNFSAYEESWVKEFPPGLRRLLGWIKKEYGNPDVFITESGTADPGNVLDDTGRIRYIRSYLDQVLKGRLNTLMLVFF
jgi:hypothetical protein